MNNIIEKIHIIVHRILNHYLTDKLERLFMMCIEDGINSAEFPSRVLKDNICELIDDLIQK